MTYILWFIIAAFTIKLIHLSKVHSNNEEELAKSRDLVKKLNEEISDCRNALNILSKDDSEKSLLIEYLRSEYKSATAETASITKEYHLLRKTISRLEADLDDFDFKYRDGHNPDFIEESIDNSTDNQDDSKKLFNNLIESIYSEFSKDTDSKNRIIYLLHKIDLLVDELEKHKNEVKVLEKKCSEENLKLFADAKSYKMLNQQKSKINEQAKIIKILLNKTSNLS